MNLQEEIVSLLTSYNYSVATAESCTGGMVASSIVDVAGASSCFNEGYITYSNAAKIKNLGVLSSTLKEHGAVSEETAKEMAEGVRHVAEADFGVSTTGIAGPDGGSKEKPIGLVYIACSYDKDTVVRKLNLSGNREEVRKAAAKNALLLLKDCIKITEE